MDRIRTLEVKQENLDMSNKTVMDKLDKIENKLNDFILEIKTSYLTKVEAQDLFSSKRAERIVFGLVWMILLFVWWKILWMIG